MSSLPAERLERLRAFGLSEYQARAYVALLELGKTEARDVSRLSKVPLAKVYHTLQQLQERGLAEMFPENPRQFAPVPFDRYLDGLRKEHETRIAALEEDREELRAIFALKGNVDADDRGTVTVVRGRLQVAQALLGLATRAERELLVLPSKGLTTDRGLRFLRPPIEAAHARGVRVRLSWPALACGSLLPEGVAPDASLPAPTEPVALVVTDAAAALLVHFVPDDGDGRRGHDVAISIDHPAIARALRSFAGSAWTEDANGEAGRAVEAPTEKVLGHGAALAVAPDGALRGGARTRGPEPDDAWGAPALPGVVPVELPGPPSVGSLG